MTMEINSQVELHDSDRIKLNKLKIELEQFQGKGGINLEAFRKHALDRFHAIGFEVDDKIYETNVEGVYWFEWSIVKRLEGEFDPEQQHHEVVNDILGTGQSGMIKQTKSGLQIVEGKKVF
jgi:hypothetical protein